MKCFPLNASLPEEVCPACRATTSFLYAKVPGRRAAQNSIFDYLQCVACGSVFLSQRTPPPSEIYTAHYFAPSSLGIAGRFWVDLGLRLQRDRLPPLPSDAKILDIGFGAGEWMLFLESRGFEMHGLDPSSEACASARRRGLVRISQGTPRDHPLESETYDAITAYHCLEHDADPLTFLRHATALLRPGGWLIIAIPNVAGWEARHSKAAWYHLDPPYHLCLPSPKAMDRLMETVGLTNRTRVCPILDYVQSLGYAWLRKPRTSALAAAALLPITLPANALLAAAGETGVMEFHGQKPH